jgi:hypothetical protein
MSDKINAHLAGDGVVMVSTYGRATQYDKKHAGMFFMANDNLHVKRGKNSDCLSFGDNLLVSIKFYSYSPLVKG